MDVLAELLPPSYLVKAENTAKDKKQKNQQSQKKISQYSYDEYQAEQEELSSEQTAHWDSVERRSGEDRRQDAKCRGRWLESRAEKDRRQQSKAIAIKI